MVIGSLSALIGILYATIQGEMKRLLAHSTIENMEIITAGIGAAMVFFATGHQVVGAIALIAALYHLANHSVYKALLFIGTGRSRPEPAPAISTALTASFAECRGEFGSKRLNLNVEFEPNNS